MIHELKIKQVYLIRILTGEKTFEIRKNDRDFQVDDCIKFLPLVDDNYNAYDVETPLPLFSIKYVLSGFEGLADGYVALGISRDND